MIRDAMELARRLGHRYLWVDALCIVQDDETTKSNNVHNMAAIYANATFTIIAADGDAATGLVALRWCPLRGDQAVQRGIPLRRTFKFHEYTFMCTSFSSFEETPTKSGYSQRGWTFQEYHTSARRLIFYGGIAHWECSCAIWHEDRYASANFDQFRQSRPLRRMINSLPILTDYIDLVNAFNVRQLTYDKDALPAISDILAVLSRTFNGGFLWGLPEMYSDMALFWRVKDRIKKREDGSDSPLFPSWS